MGKYKFKSPGGTIFLRGRDAIMPESLTDEQVEKLVESHPELKAQFDGFQEPKEEKPAADKSKKAE